VNTLRCILLPALAIILFAQAQHGLGPHKSVSDYPVNSTLDGVSIGASMMTAEQVRRTFVSDVNRGYVVIEVALYPSNKGALNVSYQDFTLQIAGARTTARPVSARTIAGVLQKTAPAYRDVNVYPQVGIGYDRAGGVWKQVGLGIGVDASRPGATDKDRDVMEQELSDKSLPEQTASAPVAGYLYFPIGARKKGVRYELSYESAAGKMILPFPAEK